MRYIVLLLSLVFFHNTAQAYPPKVFFNPPHERDTDYDTVQSVRARVDSLLERYAPQDILIVSDVHGVLTDVPIPRRYTKVNPRGHMPLYLKHLMEQKVPVVFSSAWLDFAKVVGDLQTLDLIPKEIRGSYQHIVLNEIEAIVDGDREPSTPDLARPPLEVWSLANIVSCRYVKCLGPTESVRDIPDVFGYDSKWYRPLQTQNPFYRQKAYAGLHSVQQLDTPPKVMVFIDDSSENCSVFSRECLKLPIPSLEEVHILSMSTTSRGNIYESDILEMFQALSPLEPTPIDEGYDSASQPSSNDSSEEAGGDDSPRGSASRLSPRLLKMLSLSKKRDSLKVWGEEEDEPTSEDGSSSSQPSSEEDSEESSEG